MNVTDDRGEQIGCVGWNSDATISTGSIGMGQGADNHKHGEIL